jgi:hypothetical protein
MNLPFRRANPTQLGDAWYEDGSHSRPSHEIDGPFLLLSGELAGNEFIPRRGE